ncbi:zinc ribbon domain-containing protein [Myceligenerans indicum]|uniref:zinc ribbon domain-containing protein n=1 Tax=Myceligenerans indicum TaxID=2593663 RepID=UPI00191FB938|nr:zinc ribbon domain-containing protein [Myceligenerans indicum]
MTSATGKLRRYRYYTCFTRARYGRTGCDAARIDADLLDTAVTDALIGFFANTDLIVEAVAAERSLRADGSHRHHAELDAITEQITTTEAAIDRYLTAFENGTLDERTCGRRLNDLTVKLDQLKTRQDELRQLCHDLPQLPSPTAIERLRQDLAYVLRHGTPGQRKAVIEAHVAEIKIQGSTLTPVYKIPTSHFTQDDEGSAETSADPEFRTMRHVVGLAPAFREFWILARMSAIVMLAY